MKLLEETLALQKSKLGPDHPDTLWSMNALAGTYSAMGRRTEALKLHEQALALRKSKLGPEHPDTLQSMGNLAFSYNEVGRHEEALKVYEETLALEKTKLGADHPRTLTTMNNLAATYEVAGRHADALKLQKETLALMKSKLGADHPNTLVSMANVAQSLIRLDRSSEAVAIIDECSRCAEGKVVDPRLVPFVLDLRLRVYEKQKDPSGCQQTAEMWEKLNRTDADGLYNAARYWAVTAGVLRADDKTPEAVKQAHTAGDRAIGWLAKAITAGYNTPQQIGQMMRDHDLDALKNRADFRRLIRELLDRVFPADPFAR